MSSETSGAVGRELMRFDPKQVTWSGMWAARLKSRTPLYDPDHAAHSDPDWWAKINRDSVLAHAIRQRRAKVVSPSWNIDPGGESDEDRRLASIVEEMFRGIRHFSMSRRHLANFAFLGNAHAWIEGKRRYAMYGASEENPVGVFAEWWTPTYLRPIDKRQVLLVPVKVVEDGEETVRVETLLATPTSNGKHVPIANPECLVSVVYDDEVERLGSGRGIGEALYESYRIKGAVREELLQGIEKWAQGIVVAKVGATKHATADVDTADVATAVMEKIQTMRQGGSIVVDKDDDVSVLRGGGEAGGAGPLDAMRYEDEGATQIALGALLPTGGGGDVGSNARAEEESNSTEDLLDGDREMLDEAITDRLVRLVVELNAAPFAEAGLGGAKMPRFRSIDVGHEDPEKAGRVLKQGQGLGLEIGAEEAYRRMGISRPGPTEDKITAPAPSFGGGGFPFGGPDDVPPEFAALGASGVNAWRAFARSVTA